MIGGHVSHDVFHKVITENQNAHHVWWLIQLHSHLNACEIYVLQRQRSSGNDELHWCFGTYASVLDVSFTVANHLLHLCGHVGPPKQVL